MLDSAMKSQPVIIYKTRMGIPDGQPRRFRTTYGKDGAIEWLRGEGCRFPNSIMNHIGDESVEITTMECEYEIQAMPTGVGARRRPKSVKDTGKG